MSVWDRFAGYYYFNPRPPCGRRRAATAGLRRQRIFQPTSPVRETTGAGNPLLSFRRDFNPRPPCGRRHLQILHRRFDQRFQPTSPVRETTWPARQLCIRPPISTHVPRAGDDQILDVLSQIIGHFNPRPPCGRRPGRGGGRKPDRQISTHVPRAGDDHEERHLGAIVPDFNPRPPCGRRREG